MALAEDAATVLQADEDCHSSPYALSGNKLLADTMRLHRIHFRRATREVLRCPGISTGGWQEHERILIERVGGDAEAAGEVMRRHIVGAHRRVGRTRAASAEA